MCIFSVFLRRCEDLRKQNTLLHEHLESVSAQAAQISNDSINSAAGMLNAAEEGTLEDTDENKTQSIQQLRGLIRYLRNNHDLIQNQLSLAKHESERLQKQLQHTSKDLDQTRSELNQVCHHDPSYVFKWFTIPNLVISMCIDDYTVVVCFLFRSGSAPDKDMYPLRSILNC